MSEQLKITVPLPPQGSAYLKVFEEFFTAQVPQEHLSKLKADFLALKAEVNRNIQSIQSALSTMNTPVAICDMIWRMRQEEARIRQFMDNSALPPSLDEIAGAVILDNYFLSDVDGGAVVAEMKAVCIRRYKAAFPNVDRNSILRTQELLDDVFKSINDFYVGNKTSHQYMQSLIQHYDTLIPSLITKSMGNGLDIYMHADYEPPKLTASEAEAMERAWGKEGKIAHRVSV